MDFILNKSDEEKQMEKNKKILMNEPVSEFRQVIQIGDSEGVTLDPKNLKYSGVKKGDKIRIWYRLINDVELEEGE